MSEQHIRAWQQRIGVKVDGDFGPKTLARSLEVYARAYPESDNDDPPATLPDGSGEHRSPFGFKLGPTSESRLLGVHADLVRVVRRAAELSEVEFVVLEGLRTAERQRQLYAKGATKTLNSRHLTGHAVDIAPWIGGKVSWDWPAYIELAPTVKRAADEVGVPVEWGGDWASFRDGPHWQLPWSYA